MATDFVKKWQTPHFHRSGIQKRNGILPPPIHMRINSANDASILCENFIKFCSVTPELTQLICEVMYDMAKNWRISSNITGHTGPIFAIFLPHESVLRADDGSVPYLSRVVAMATK